MLVILTEFQAAEVMHKTKQRNHAFGPVGSKGHNWRDDSHHTAPLQSVLCAGLYTRHQAHPCTLHLHTTQ